jgi:type IV pilus assembly protein PilM
LPTVIVDVGPATTDIAILDSTVRVSGSIAIGGNTFTLAIAKQLKVPLENAHQMKVQHGLSVSPRQAKLLAALEPNLRQITAEIRKMIRYYNERLETEKKLEQVLIVGGGSNVPGLGEYFTNALLMPARVASPWQVLNFGNLEEPAKQFKSRYITVAGLATVKPGEIFK